MANRLQGRRPGTRAGMSPAQVLEAARALVDRDGAEGLTMRRLADRLSVAPNTLYSHYPDKAALLDAVLDSLLGEVDPRGLGAMDWRDGMVTLMSASREMLLKHADLLPHLLSRPARGPNAGRLADEALALLARGGIEGRLAVDALRALLTFTFGSVVLDAPRRRDPDPAGRVAKSRAAFAAQRDRPHVVRVAEALAELPNEESFARSLRWLIDGIAGAAAPER